MDILGAIGNTSMVRLRKVVPAGCANVLAKLEWDRIDPANIPTSLPPNILTGVSPGSRTPTASGYTPPLFDPTLVDEIVAVKTDDAKEMARRIAREEGVFAGTSSGANVVAAIQVAERLGPEATVVTLMADSGLKYLNSEVYRR